VQCAPLGTPTVRPRAASGSPPSQGTAAWGAPAASGAAALGSPHSQGTTALGPPAASGTAALGSPPAPGKEIGLASSLASQIGDGPSLAVLGQKARREEEKEWGTTKKEQGKIEAPGIEATQGSDAVGGAEVWSTAQVDTDSKRSSAHGGAAGAPHGTSVDEPPRMPQQPLEVEALQALMREELPPRLQHAETTEDAEWAQGDVGDDHGLPTSPVSAANHWQQARVGTAAMSVGSVLMTMTNNSGPLGFVVGKVLSNNAPLHRLAHHDDLNEEDAAHISRAGWLPILQELTKHSDAATSSVANDLLAQVSMGLNDDDAADQPADISS